MPAMVANTYYALQNVASGNYTVSVASFDGSNASFPIELDATQINKPGRYVVIKSTAQLSQYVKATASFVGTTALKVKDVTASGTGEPINYSGTTFYCVVVTVG